MAPDDARQLIDLARWLLGILGASMVTVIGLSYKAGRKQGEADEQMKTISRISHQLEPLPELIVKVGQLVEFEREMSHHYPALEKRVSKCEWVLDIEPTGKHSVVPPPRNGDR